MIEAIATVGPHTGLRVYAKSDTHNPVIWIEATARQELLGLARSALEDIDAKIGLKKGDDVYVFKGGITLAGDIIRALEERG